MWGIASIYFGSTYTKNDYLGKKVLSPVPRGVGCVCGVRCRWALLTLLVSGCLIVVLAPGFLSGVV